MYVYIYVCVCTYIYIYSRQQPNNNSCFTFHSPSAPFLLGLFKAKSRQGHIGYFRLWEACDTWHLDMKDNGLGRRKWQWKIYENVQASRKRLSDSATKCCSGCFLSRTCADNTQATHFAVEKRHWEEVGCTLVRCSRAAWQTSLEPFQ